MAKKKIWIPKREWSQRATISECERILEVEPSKLGEHPSDWYCFTVDSEEFRLMKLSKPSDNFTMERLEDIEPSSKEQTNIFPTRIDRFWNWVLENPKKVNPFLIAVFLIGLWMIYTAIK